MGSVALASGLNSVSLASVLKKKRKLAFSTLACPDWSWQEIVSNARKYGFQGVEIRGIQSELSIPDSIYFKGQAWKDSLKLADDNGIQIINLNSSSHLHETDPLKNKKQMDEVKRNMELAAKLNCPFVRVFPDRFPAELTKEQTIDLFAGRLNELREYGKGSGVKVLLDAHGDLSDSSDIKAVLDKTEKGGTGLIWDYFNMYSQIHEELDPMFENLKEYISLVQLKDGTTDKEGAHVYTFLGGGFLPKMAILEKLDEINYNGFISFEWEKTWHPELPDPEIALPDFIRKMN